MPQHLVLGEGARVGHFNVCRGIERLDLGSSATIGRGNWITGTPLGDDRYFLGYPTRQPQLVLGPHAAVTHRHYLDCTDSVTIGSFATVAGVGSQFWTHGLDVIDCEQSAGPIQIGSYTMVGTRCTVLKGSVLPECAVLAAGSVLSGVMTDRYQMYGGTPAKPLRSISPDAKYFTRSVGRIH